MYFFRSLSRLFSLCFILAVTVACTDNRVAIEERDGSYQVPKDTRLSISLDSELSSNVNRRGDTFQTKLLTDLKLGDAIVLPEGTIIKSLVKSASRYEKFGDKASLALLFDQVVLADGRVIPLVASLDTRSGKPPIKVKGKALQESKTVLETAVMGALLEDTQDTSKLGYDGLLLGAMMGTGAVLLSNAKEVRLPVGTEITISLDQALSIPKSQDVPQVQPSP